MSSVIVVAEYRPDAAEGAHVVSKAVIDGLRARRERVEVVEPQAARFLLPILFQRPSCVVFTHGPGPGTVLLSVLLRILSRARVVWVATRPDVGGVPRVLQGLRTAHTVIGNRRLRDLEAVSPGAVFRQSYIGLDRRRITSTGPNAPWPELRAAGRVVALHVGHLRANRGLEVLAAAKRHLGHALEVVVQASPRFAEDPEVVRDLVDAGVHIRRSFVEHPGDLYRSADLYLFPVPDERGGAVELPLSVLEALACGTPVLTTRFGALPVGLAGVDGVHFADLDDFVQCLSERVAALESGQTEPVGLPPALELEAAIDVVLDEIGADR